MYKNQSQNQYTCLLFEITDLNQNKLLAYAKIDMTNYYAYVDTNLNSNTDSDDVKNFIRLLLEKKEIKFNNVKLIQILPDEISTEFYSHFNIVLNQFQEPELLLETLNYKKYFMASDYDSDEYEYIWDEEILSKFLPDLHLEELIEYYSVDKENKYSIDICVGQIENLIEEEYPMEIWNDKTHAMEEYDLTLDEYEKKLPHITKINSLLVKKLEQINQFKMYFSEDFIKTKISDASARIKYLTKLLENENLTEANKKQIKLKIGTQVCRQFKYENLSGIKFNFVVTNFEEITNYGDKVDYLIEISNIAHTVNSTYKYECIGDPKSGYDSNRYYLTQIKDSSDPDDIIDADTISGLFEFLKYKLF